MNNNIRNQGKHSTQAIKINGIQRKGLFFFFLSNNKRRVRTICTEGFSLERSISSVCLQPLVILGLTISLFSQNGKIAGTKSIQIKWARCNFGTESRSDLSADVDKSDFVSQQLFKISLKQAGSRFYLYHIMNIKDLSV